MTEHETCHTHDVQWINEFFGRRIAGYDKAGIVMKKPTLNGIYLIELCSGERRRWQYRGPDERAQIWWRDMETGREFAETSMMYTWWIVDIDDVSLDT